MKERGEIRQIQPRVQDFFAVEVTGNQAYLTEQIAENAVQKFCGGCDFLPESGVCKIAGSNDQARYAAREWCGWSSVNGVRGEMTAEGFKGESQTPQSPATQ